MVRYLGFACVTYAKRWTTNRTFRLANLSEKKVVETVNANLDDMERILAWMAKFPSLRLFRIGSSLIPFASHEKFRFDWRKLFGERLKEISEKFLPLGFRFSMHPGQYIVINSPSLKIYRRAVSEIIYSCQVLDAMSLDNSHKVIVHGGGIYGDKVESLSRLAKRLKCLPEEFRKRIALEHDEHCFSFADIVSVCEEVGVAPVFDWHHQSLLPTMDLERWLLRAKALWDGIPEVHISSQKPNASAGAHDLFVRTKDLRGLIASLPFVFDLMIEAKAKEVAALKVRGWLKRNNALLTEK
ncbi:MAG: UV DNA damage repair endonuclease UvsE [Armatimonadetes bacterium]|nr:UV DNA damage repair endonuclease UvsE [Armatimonadota bacterium]MDW8028343.1 UV DNA damage repair endonuclease UvsE [Armatimonadota bacterium]